MTNTTQLCMWSVNQHRCRLTEGGFYNPLPLKGTWFGMALNVADPPRGRANRVEVGNMYLIVFSGKSKEMSNVFYFNYLLEGSLRYPLHTLYLQNVPLLRAGRGGSASNHCEGKGGGTIMSP